MPCPCCNPPEFQCCCVGEAPVLNTSDYRRIEFIPYGDPCDGTRIAYASQGSPCDARSIIAEWCGMAVEITYPSGSATTSTNPGTGAGGCGTITSQTLSIDPLPAGNFQSPSGWNAECGRCVFRFLVTVQQNTFDCGSRTKSYFIDFRDGCDSSVNIQLWDAGSDESLFACDTVPTVTTTLAP